MKFVRRLVLSIVMLAVAAGAVMNQRPLWVADQGLHFKLWRAGVHSSYVATSQGRLHYFDTDASKATQPVTVLLVHGLADRSETWTPVLLRLKAQGFHVYAVDLLGYGRSDTPDSDYSIASQARAVAEFMQATKMGRADVIGWSMGGWTTAELALNHPEMVRRIALFDSAGVLFATTLSPDIFVPRNADAVYDLVDKLLAKPRPMPRFVAVDVARRLQEKGWVTRRSLASMMAGKDLLDFRLGKMAVPMLIVWGNEDKLIPVSAGETMHQLDPASHFVTVAGCGHGGPDECAPTFERVAADYFRAPEAIAGGEEHIAEDPR